MSITTTLPNELTETLTHSFVAGGTLPGSDSADVFHGRDHGNVPISMFLVHNRPGEGPELHRHPYTEVFVIHSGEARFQLDDATLSAVAGDIVIASAGAAHRFTNAGSSELSMTCIHAAAEMVSAWL